MAGSPRVVEDLAKQLEEVKASAAKKPKREPCKKKVKKKSQQSAALGMVAKDEVDPLKRREEFATELRNAKRKVIIDEKRAKIR